MGLRSLLAVECASYPVLRGSLVVSARHYNYVLELLGQTALFENGYDSDNLPADDEAITGFREKLREKGEVAFSKTPYGQLKAAREHAARFLKFLGDSRGKRLLRLAGDRDLAIRKRNRRILMHGYKAEASSSEDTLKNMYKELEKLVVDGSKEAPRQLETARKPEFWQEGSA